MERTDRTKRLERNRIDQISRAMATRSSRRRAVRAGGGLSAGLLASLGLKRPGRAQDADIVTCVMVFAAGTAIGSAQGEIYAGTLTVAIGADGTFTSGDLTTDDGQTFEVVGQALGQDIALRIQLADAENLWLNGVSRQPLRGCRGRSGGTFSGPGPGNIGTWEARADSGSDSGPGSGTSEGSTEGGDEED